MLRDDSFQAEFLCNLGRYRVRSEPRNRHGGPTRSLVQYFIRSNDKLGRNCDAKLRCGRAIDSELKTNWASSARMKAWAPWVVKAPTALVISSGEAALTAMTLSPASRAAPSICLRIAPRAEIYSSPIGGCLNGSMSRNNSLIV